MKKPVTIIIKGQTNSGKSRISYLLKLFLRQYGFEVTHILDDDHPNESNFDSVVGSDIEDAISSIKEKTSIIIKEVRASSISNDNELIKICQIGFEDEKNLNDEKNFDTPIKQRAYIIGRKYALIGDELRDLTNYSFQQILDEIKNT
jgi:hypothetical protein